MFLWPHGHKRDETMEQTLLLSFFRENDEVTAAVSTVQWVKRMGLKSRNLFQNVLPSAEFVSSIYVLFPSLILVYAADAGVQAEGERESESKSSRSLWSKRKAETEGKKGRAGCAALVPIAPGDPGTGLPLSCQDV